MASAAASCRKPPPRCHPNNRARKRQLEPVAPTATPPRPDMIILLVDQQQALILQWLQQESGVALNLVLRGASDNAPVSTETVSYQYILTNFNITIPPKTNTIIVGKDQWTRSARRNRTERPLICIDLNRSLGVEG